MTRRTALATVALLCCASVAPAQPGALDLVPHDAGAAVAARNVKELREKGDRAFKEMKLQREIRISDLFDQLYQLLGVKEAVAEDGSVAVIVVSAKSIGAPPVGPKATDTPVEELLVV